VDVSDVLNDLDLDGDVDLTGLTGLLP